jgi:hypothetical protein
VGDNSKGPAAVDLGIQLVIVVLFCCHGRYIKPAVFL